jgi:two-component system KDP operon response regulator KdpE
VIVVEDEPQIRRFVCDALRKEGCASLEAATARRGWMPPQRQADLVILDLGLPDMNGIDFIRDLRAWSPAADSHSFGALGGARQDRRLDAGADDYLCKPFGVGELLARVRPCCRRHWHSGESHAAGIASATSRWILSAASSAGGVEIHLTQIEYRLLAVMLANSGKVLTHRHLMQEVWGPGYREQGHYLRIYVGRLRQKLESTPPSRNTFLTETGVGYRFQS